MPRLLNAPLKADSQAIGTSDCLPRPLLTSQPCQLPFCSGDSGTPPTLLQGSPSALPYAFLSYYLYGTCSSQILATWLLPSRDGRDTFSLLRESTVELVAGVLCLGSQSGDPWACPQPLNVFSFAIQWCLTYCFTFKFGCQQLKIRKVHTHKNFGFSWINHTSCVKNQRNPVLTLLTISWR